MAVASQKHNYAETTQYIYNLGYAHGHPRASNTKEFAGWIKERVGTTFNIICFTNSQQSTERGFLKELGFETIHHEESTMNAHYISKEVWKKTCEKLDLFTFLERKEFEKREAARIRAERRAASGGRNKDGSLPRKRGEFRVGDRVGQWIQNGYWQGPGTVSEVHANGEITITPSANLRSGSGTARANPTPFTFRPVVNNGWNAFNIQRRVNYW